jgi:alpha-1,3-rhamnosyl/mannosyltransferase
VRIAYDGVPLLGERTGIGHYTYELIRAIARAEAGARCVVVYPWTVNPFRPITPAVFDDPRIESPLPSFPVRLRRRLRERLGVPAPLEDLIGPLDVYHATNYLVAHPIRAARRVVTIHDLTLIRSPEWHPARRLREMGAGLRVSAEAADRIIAISQATKDDVVAHLGVDPGRVAVVPLGIDPSFHPLPRAETERALARYGLGVGSYLLFLGTVEPRKNLGRVLDAIARLDPGIGPLVVAGGSGWGNAELSPRLAELARRGRVRRLGYVGGSLRVPLLAGARAFVFPSLYEGFGLPPLEAMACGTPVVTSGVSALPEVVGDAALLVDPLDVDALAGAIRRLWTDEGLRQDLRVRGLSRVRRYTWDATARLTLEVYAAAMRA